MPSVIRSARWFLGLAAWAAPLAAQQSFPPDSAIRAVLTERLASRPTVGMVVGAIDRTGNRRVVAHGASGTDRPLDDRTVFEIGSITKVFTTAILADMVRKGEVALEDPVANYLPRNGRVPERAGRRIMLLDLATQSSGLPRMPANFAPRNPANPYADYTAEQLYAFLAGYELPRDPGSRYEYSNLGMGLLGHALARKAGTGYEELVTARVLRPLGMRDTRIALTPELRARLALGHDQGGSPVPNWDIATLEGAGALRSTVEDMLTFMVANLDSTATPLSRALALAHGERVATGSPGLSVGLAWHRLARPSGGVIVWHNGGTGGYHSFTGFDPTRGAGVVVLSNSSADIDDIGFHLLDPSFPLVPPPRQRTEVAVDSVMLQRYVGEYEVTPQFVLTITREGSQLYVQATGQARVPLYAESEGEFFLKVVDAQVSFVRDSTGRISQLVLHQAGQNIPARRR